MINQIKMVEEDDELSAENLQILKLSEIPWKTYLAEKGYGRDIKTMCEECVTKQIKEHGRRVIPCKGLADAKSMLGEEAYNEITAEYSKEEIDLLNAIYDPYEYMETYLDLEKKGKPERRFSRRWYQERVVKCLSEDTPILMGGGSHKAIKDVQINDLVVSYNETDDSLPINKVLNKWYSGEKEVFQIILESGDKLEATGDHPILTCTGLEKLHKCPAYKSKYLSIKDGLAIGMDVYTLNKASDFSSTVRTKIIDIIPLGVKPTYDIEVDERHNFVASNIIVHNCTAQSKVVRMGRRTGKTFALAILILHKLITNSDFRVLLVSPYAVQTEEVIDNIKNLCSLLPENPLVSSKASPNHVLKFNTGSVLKGFTASTDANSVRGQPGHLLVLDEIDDIPEKAMISIMGIKMDNPNVEIWRSGTPKGEINLHKAEQDITSKSFHYPSFVIPHYDDKLDKELREELGEIGFVQETMAEFGLVSNGVFQSTFINKAQQREQFLSTEDVLRDRSRYIVTIGVDWNHDQVGTRIVVIAYDKLNPQFRIVEKAAIAQVGYTQQAAMEKIIHLNRKYNADHIFCDEGFGAAQIGDLKRVGEASVGVLPKGHPDLKLLDVQAVNFSSNTEFKDPVTGDIYKTPTKQFAVQNTVVMLERDLIALHPKEDNDIILQMKNYIEKSRNKGRVVYSYISKKIGDHDLDALMIGLYGYRKIYSTLFEGSVFQAMIKFANKADPDMDGSMGVNSPDNYSDDITSFVQIKFSKTPKHFSSRTSKMGGINSRNRSNFR